MVTKPGDFHQNRNMKYDNFRTNKYEFVWNPKKIRKAEHTVRHNHAHGPHGAKEWLKPNLDLDKFMLPLKSMTGYISFNPKSVFKGPILEDPY